MWRNESVVAAFDFSLIQDELALVEEQLRQVADVDLPALAEILGQLLQSGGKRLRPALVLLSARFREHDVAKAVAVAAAVEVLHTATLVHDDLIDNSLLRRGNPTLNSYWKSGVVVLVGDYLFGQAAELESRSRNLDMSEIFAKTVSVICRGELGSMLDRQPWAISRQGYYDKIYAKTASLFATCSEAGAIISGSNASERAQLREYGRNLGMAFQVADDILDFVGDESILGKPVGSDLRQGTVTLPSLLYVEKHRSDALVRSVIDGTAGNGEVSELVDLIRRSSAIEESFTIARGFVREAKGTLRALPDAPCRRTLLDLADFVVERTS